MAANTVSLDNHQPRTSTDDSGFSSFIRVDSLVNKWPRSGRDSEDDILNTAYMEPSADSETSPESEFYMEHHLKQMMTVLCERKNGDPWIKSNAFPEMAKGTEHKNNDCGTHLIPEGCVDLSKTLVLADKMNLYNKEQSTENIASEVKFTATSCGLTAAFVSSSATKHVCTPISRKFPSLPSLYDTPSSDTQKLEKNITESESLEKELQKVHISPTMINICSSSDSNLQDRGLLCEFQRTKPKGFRYFPPIFDTSISSYRHSSPDELSEISLKDENHLCVQEVSKPMIPLSSPNGKFTPLDKKLVACLSEETNIVRVEKDCSYSLDHLPLKHNPVINISAKDSNEVTPTLSRKLTVSSKKSSVVEGTKTARAKKVNSQSLSKLPLKCNSKAKVQMSVKKASSSPISSFKSSRKFTSLSKRKLLSNSSERTNSATVQKINHTLGQSSLKSNLKTENPIRNKKISNLITHSSAANKKSTSPHEKLLVGTCEKKSTSTVKRVNPSSVGQFPPKSKFKAKNTKTFQKTSNMMISSAVQGKSALSQSKKLISSTSRKTGGASGKNVNSSSLKIEPKGNKLKNVKRESIVVSPLLGPNKRPQPLNEKSLMYVLEKTNDIAAKAISPNSAAHLLDSEAKPDLSLVQNYMCGQNELPCKTPTENSMNLNTDGFHCIASQVNCTPTKCLESKKINLQDLEAIQQVLKKQLKHLHPFLETGSYRSPENGISPNDYLKVIKEQKVAFHPDLSIIPEIDSPSSDSRMSSMNLCFKPVSNLNNTAVDKQELLCKTKSSLLSKDFPLKSSGAEAVSLLTGEQEVVINDVMPIKTSCSEENLTEMFKKPKVPHSTLMKAYDLSKEKGILEETDLTLIGPELTVNSVVHEEYGGEKGYLKDKVWNHSASAAQGTTVFTDSLLSFLQHEHSCLNSPDSVISFLH